MISGAIYASKSLSRPTRHCASPNGGRPPLDLKSRDPSFQTDITRRFDKDADAEGQLDKAVRPESVKQEATRPSSIRAVTARCGTWPKTPIPSS
jgi:hypothetical protein